MKAAISLNATWKDFSVPIANVADNETLPAFVFWNNG